MRRTSPYEELQRRMQSSYQKLDKIAKEKTKGKREVVIYTRIGLDLGITHQTVNNYVNGRSKNGNGYLIDALITEFEKLETPS